MSGSARLLVATHNSGKLREFDRLLQLDGVELVSLAQVGIMDAVVEDGDSFEANARKKAIEYAKRSGLLTIADDSGLCVDALDGAPGIHSARFAGETGNAALNNRRLLEALAGVPESHRTARFVCALVVASPIEVLVSSFGQCEGTIAFSPRGKGGFGYDPLFVVAGLDRTAAELSVAEKSKHSHRARAIYAIRDALQATIAQAPGV